MGAMQIHISIQTTQPLTGAAKTESVGLLRFEGWLELLHVLATLIEAEPVPRIQQRGCDAGGGDAGADPADARYTK